MEMSNIASRELHPEGKREGEKGGATLRALGTDGFHLELSGNAQGSCVGMVCGALLSREAAEVPFPAPGELDRSHHMAFPRGCAWREQLSGVELNLCSWLIAAGIPGCHRALSPCSQPGFLTAVGSCSDPP